MKGQIVTMSANVIFACHHLHGSMCRNPTSTLGSWEEEFFGVVGPRLVPFQDVRNRGKNENDHENKVLESRVLMVTNVRYRERFGIPPEARKERLALIGRGHTECCVTIDWPECGSFDWRD